MPSKIPGGVRINTERGKPSCKESPEGTVAMSSGTTVESIVLAAGYYRTSNDSEVVIQCYRSDACVGGIDPVDYCADGYDGACKYKYRQHVVVQFWRG